MEHLFNFGSNSAGDLYIVPISTDKLFAFFATKMSHVRTTTKHFTGAGNFEPLHDNFSSLLFEFGHFISLALSGQ